MKINRLFEIVYILLSKKSVTAAELSKHFEVSTRTVYRDLDILTAAGIPVYANKGKSGGIMLTDDFVLDKSMLSKTERDNILFALQSLKAAKYPDVENVLSKLGSFFNKPSQNWIQIDFHTWGNHNNDLFVMLKKAILENRVAEFDYFDTRGNKTHRKAEPLQLWFKEKSWYLKAYCRHKQSVRLFKTSRVKNMRITNETFFRENKDAGHDFNNLSNSSKPIKIKLKIGASQAFRVYDEFSEKQIKKHKDGSFTAEIEFPEDGWVYGYILSFGPHCEVLAPLRLRKIIKDKLKTALKVYL